MTNKDNSVEEEIDKIVGTFVSLKYDEDTDEYSDGTLERWNNMKRAITTLLELEYKKGYSDGTRDYAKTLENLALEGDK